MIASTEATILETEIIRGAIKAAIREMMILMERTSMSPIIREKRDYFVGIFNTEGRIVAARLANTGPGMLDKILEQYPPETMEPGDIYSYNDPYTSGGGVSHTPDMVFVTPLFFEGRLLAFVATFGHFADIGGLRAGSVSAAATEVFHEGIRIPPVRMVRAGQLNEEAYRILLTNSRSPAFLEGDTKAMMASCRLGQRRLLELCERFGPRKVLATFDHIVEQNGQAARQLFLGAVPEGEYEFTELLDSDEHNGRPIKVQLALRRTGDHVVADLSGSGPQSRGSNNLMLTPGQLQLSFGRYLTYLDRTLEINQGLLTSLDEVILRPGTVVCPRFPAALGSRSYTRFRVVSCMLGVMAQANPDRSPAGSPAYSLCYLRLWDERAQQLRFLNDALGVGLGARPTADGTDVIYSISQQNYPVEFVEKEYPFRIERYGIHRDSGGPGTFRGGCGLVRDIRMLAKRTIIGTRMENVEFPAWGVRGGKAGRPGRFVVNPGTPRERLLKPHGEDAELFEGDLLRIMTSGGGGWGDPLRRDPARVLRDVQAKFVSVEGARDDYGVVLRADLSAVDPAATEALRRSMARDDLPTFDRGANFEAVLASGIADSGVLDPSLLPS